MSCIMDGYVGSRVGLVGPKAHSVHTSSSFTRLTIAHGILFLDFHHVTGVFFA